MKRIQYERNDGPLSATPLQWKCNECSTFIYLLIMALQRTNEFVHEIQVQFSLCTSSVSKSGILNIHRNYYLSFSQVKYNFMIQFVKLCWQKRRLLNIFFWIIRHYMFETNNTIRIQSARVGGALHVSGAV
ncbi:hypothetical protein T07_11798 [Trichinella nelsoni]|uniref:Uncharacterized protein n=1 Tax=Trichinella nelsoni TaxID=6336 RepID=A0A0V0RUY1_9BILA|nr:hypothetical protein T07_11798 [Trichinella nelsoni]